MIKIITTFLFVIAFIVSQAQVGNAVFIDSTIESSGISMITSGDLDNDNDNEVIVSVSSSTGVVGYYNNLSAEVFSPLQVVDSLSFCEGVAVGDFNNDGWSDLIAIGGTQHEARIYMNDAGTFPNSTQLDVNISILVNDVVVADFDQNGSDDIVIIGQHSIDFYQNDGTGSFTKTPILTTSTAPGVLECLDLSKVDLDQDGDQDLVCAETEGFTTYTNDANGNFSPNYYSTITEVGTLIHPMDIDNDGDPDVVMQNGAGDVKWFSNDGNGVFTFEAILSNIPTLKGITSVDYNADGREDIFATYTHHVVLYPNDTSLNFSVDNTIYQDNNLIMGVVHVANINAHAPKDLIWTGANKSIVFHSNQSPLDTYNYKKEAFSFYPNPAQNQVTLSSNKKYKTIEILNSQSQLIQTFSFKNQIDVSKLPPGIYYMRLLMDNGQKSTVQKLIKK